jgi:hypothetical protein
MKEQPSASAPKLIFADEERQTAGLEKSIADAEKAAAKRDRMKARLRMEHGPKKKPAAGVPSIVPDATAGEMPEKPAVPRLLFSDEARVKVPGKTGQGIIGKTVSSEVHRQIAQDEEDNTGLQALHATERTSESALHTVQQVRHCLALLRETGTLPSEELAYYCSWKDNIRRYFQQIRQKD